MSKIEIPIGGKKKRAWRLKKKHRKHSDFILSGINEIITLSLPMILDKDLTFSPPIYDTIKLWIPPKD